MRRPKRHQSKLQQRCEHLRRKVKWLSEAYDDLARDNRGLEILLRMAKADLEKDKKDLIAQLAESQVKQRIAQDIIERARTIDFRRCQSGHYVIEVTFNGDFMGGISRYGQAQEFVAQHVAREIEHEIRSSKFIETARINERRDLEESMKRRQMLGPPGWGEGKVDG